MSPQRSSASPPRPADYRWWNDVRFRGVVAQILVVGGVIALGWYLVGNTLANLAARNIATGFGFLDREASFGISESVIAYSPADSYFRALLVGVLNTLAVSVIGIVLATILGTLAGVARLSSNWLVARLATLYVEGLRNIPLLLQLFFWYSLITEALPVPRGALHPVPGVFLSNRGMRIPWPEGQAVHWWLVAAALAGLALGLLLMRWARGRQEATGRRPPVAVGVPVLVLGLPLLAYLIIGVPMTLDVPELAGFNFRGGANLSPEFAALLIGLTTYTGTFIAEIVRGGILAVHHGQTEAALALGLSRAQTLRLILLPQALRVIVPPLTSQYLNLTKNSSLAVAIGFPDIVSVANTAINQTGQAVEGVALIMAVFLTISLSISGFMNWYNRHISLRGGR
jgi:general L-amino acid transport system permease protein